MSLSSEKKTKESGLSQKPKWLGQSRIAIYDWHSLDFMDKTLLRSYPEDWEWLATAEWSQARGERPRAVGRLAGSHLPFRSCHFGLSERELR